MHKNLVFIGFCFFCTLLSGCLGKNTKKVDLSGIEIALDTVRYEHRVFALNNEDLQKDLYSLRQQDSVLFDFYFTQIMNFGPLADTAGPMYWMTDTFLKNSADRALYDTVRQHFPSIEPQIKEIEQAFKHIAYYFPDKPLPSKLFTFVSGFSWKVVSLDTTVLGICLDMYLGENFVYYPSLDYPRYLINRFSPEYMARDAMEVLFDSYWPIDPMRTTPPIIEVMVENGKKWLFIEYMLPELPEVIITGFREEQLAWCKKAESDIWAFYNERDVFYSTDRFDHLRHVNEGPKTPGMPAEAPGNVGSWVGWQMVRSYLNKSGKSLPEVLETPVEEIIAKSGYKP